MIAKMRNKRGISPVIATVILVAVAITVAVAVAYWMSGIAAQYTAFEKVEIQTAICTWTGDTATPPVIGYWEIEIQLKNSGTATATLTNVFINDIEVDSYTAVATATPPITSTGIATTDMTESNTIESGDTVTIYVFIDGPSGDVGDPQWKKVSSGTTINIKIHSANGMDYIKLVKLT